jgi:DNA transformation protein
LQWGIEILADQENDLQQLKNLGAASVNILRAIGVSTYQDLAQIGSVEAYRRIKARGISVSKVMLYALEGALLNVHWKELPPGVKERLVEAAEQKTEIPEES